MRDSNECKIRKLTSAFCSSVVRQPETERDRQTDRQKGKETE